VNVVVAAGRRKASVVRLVVRRGRIFLTRHFVK
jgi:ribosomal protein S9